MIEKDSHKEDVASNNFKASPALPSIPFELLEFLLHLEPSLLDMSQGENRQENVVASKVNLLDSDDIF